MQCPMHTSVRRSMYSSRIGIVITTNLGCRLQHAIHHKCRKKHKGERYCMAISYKFKESVVNNETKVDIYPPTCPTVYNTRSPSSTVVRHTRQLVKTPSSTAIVIIAISLPLIYGSRIQEHPCGLKVGQSCRSHW